MVLERPVVLSFSGHDPCGGAGIQADIETMLSHHCHAASVITALTEQDSRNVKKLIPQNPEHIVAQALTLLDDLSVKAIKIGLIGHHETADAIHEILTHYPDLPVVLDPVLAAGGGASLSNAALIETILDKLLPLTTVLTPNSQEARELTGLDELDDCGLRLLERGCGYVLITGSHEATQTTVSNRLYHEQALIETYTWSRLPHSYHGSGCTLASSIAAMFAQDLNPLQVFMEAQEYTWNSLRAGYRPGRGQYVPDRLFWLEDA